MMEAGEALLAALAGVPVISEAEHFETMESWCVALAALGYPERVMVSEAAFRQLEVLLHFWLLPSNSEPRWLYVSGVRIICRTEADA